MALAAKVFDSILVPSTVTLVQAWPLVLMVISVAFVKVLVVDKVTEDVVRFD